MNADMMARWDEVVRVVDQALDSDPSERPAVVERLCSGDPVLRGEVERLLDASAAPPSSSPSPPRPTPRRWSRGSPVRRLRDWRRGHASARTR